MFDVPPASLAKTIGALLAMVWQKNSPAQNLMEMWHYFGERDYLTCVFKYCVL